MANSEFIKKVTFTEIESGDTVEGLTTPGGFARSWELCGAARKSGRLTDASYPPMFGLVVAYFAGKRAGLTDTKDTTSLDDVYAFYDKYDAEIETDGAGDTEDGEDPTSADQEDPSATS